MQKCIYLVWKMQHKMMLIDFKIVRMRELQVSVRMNRKLEPCVVLNCQQLNILFKGI